MEVNLPGCFASIWDNSEGLSVTENNIPFKKSPSILLGLGRGGEAETGVRIIHDDLIWSDPPGHFWAESATIYQMMVTIYSKSGMEKARRHKKI